MPDYRIEFKKSAFKEYRNLSIVLRAKIDEALLLLTHNPFSTLLPIKRLKGSDQLYRLRVGDYRIVYTVQTRQIIITVIKIGHRREVYRNV